MTTETGTIMVRKQHFWPESITSSLPFRQSCLNSWGILPFHALLRKRHIAQEFHIVAEQRAGWLIFPNHSYSIVRFHNQKI